MNVGPDSVVIESDSRFSSCHCQLAETMSETAAAFRLCFVCLDPGSLDGLTKDLHNKNIFFKEVMEHVANSKHGWAALLYFSGAFKIMHYL
jgi:hypothetical protein